VNDGTPGVTKHDALHYSCQTRNIAIEI